MWKRLQKLLWKTYHLLSVSSLPDVFTSPEYHVVRGKDLIAQTKIHTIHHSNVLYSNQIKSDFASHVIRVPWMQTWSLLGHFHFLRVCNTNLLHEAEGEKSHTHSSPTAHFGSLWFSLVEPWLSLGWLTKSPLFYEACDF